MVRDDDTNSLCYVSEEFSTPPNLFLTSSQLSRRHRHQQRDEETKNESTSSVDLRARKFTEKGVVYLSPTSQITVEDKDVSLSQ